MSLRKRKALFKVRYVFIEDDNVQNNILTNKYFLRFV